jgi:hypothetical protein
MAEQITPAQELLDAAAYIRTVGAAATPGPWVQEHEGSFIVHGPEGTVAEAVYRPEDAEHIPLWDPVVAELVAQLLTYEAGKHLHVDGHEVPLWSHPQMTPEVVALQPAIRLARAVLAKAAR